MASAANPASLAPRLPCVLSEQPLVDTLLFVDVDGVLNVGVREKVGGAILLNDVNAASALRLCAGNPRRHPSEAAQRLTSIWHRKLPQEGGKTYASLACRSPSMTAAVLTERLARLIKLAGERCTVVLSSSWRRPASAARVRHLEKVLSRQLGEAFAFHAATELREESRPGDRLRSIGDFVATHCARGCRDSERSTGCTLRVLVLEDFFISAPGGWLCDGCDVESVAAAERYLRGRAPAAWEATAKVVHTYDEWATPSGLGVAVGCGLTMPHFQAAVAYLGRYCSPSRGPTKAAAAALPSRACAAPAFFGLCGVRPHMPATRSAELGLCGGKEPPEQLPMEQPQLWHLLSAWPWLLGTLPDGATARFDMCKQPSVVYA